MKIKWKIFWGLSAVLLFFALMGVVKRDQNRNQVPRYLGSSLKKSDELELTKGKWETITVPQGYELSFSNATPLVIVRAHFYCMDGNGVRKDWGERLLPTVNLNLSAMGLKLEAVALCVDDEYNSLVATQALVRYTLRREYN